MKHISKIGMIVVAGGMLAATSCSDFSDYNTAVGSTDPSADKTLWENIAANEKLSDFAEVLQRVGYDKVLNASQTYTVWAPLNGSYNKDSLLALSDAKIEREFVNNLIAYYAHKETDPNDTTIFMLNEKLLKFTNKNSGALAFDAKSILPNNENPSVFNYPSLNGLLYTVSNPAVFRANGYEMYDEMASVASKMNEYVKKYERVYLDENKSVKGEIIDGVQHYDDSVLNVRNSLIQGRLGARLNDEDSLYTVLIPTDEAWDASYNIISKYYKYIPTIAYQNLSHSDVGNTKGGSTTTSSATIMAPTLGSTTISLSAPPADAELQNTEAYWNDSITKYVMTYDLIFSETMKRYNSKLVTREPFTAKDTLLTTAERFLPYPALLEDATAEVKTLSNGHARIINKYPFSAETYAPVLKTREPDRVVNAPGYGTTNFHMDNVPPALCRLDEGEDVLRWIRTELPDNSNFAPELDFYLEGVLSTTYDIYIVLVPGLVDNMAPKPYSLRVDINYTDADNKQWSGRFTGEKVVTDARDIRAVKPFLVAKNKVDTLKLGRFTFPICYAGTGCSPNIKVMHSFNTFTSANKRNYEQRLRVANIILKPVHEQEENATKED